MNYPEQPRQGRRFAGACTIARALSPALIVLLLAACQLLPQSDEVVPEDSPETTERVSDAAEVESVPSMQMVISSLEAGQLEQAEGLLLRLLDARPGNRLALRFLEQLQSDPFELMGDEYQEVTVRPGESLSVIAARELGDGMQFFALARYNEITVPRRLAPGMRLKIPQSLKSAPAIVIDEPAEAVAVTVVDQPGEGLALTGRHLIADQRYQQAIALLTAAARAGNLDSNGHQALALAGVARARELEAEGELDAGLELIERLNQLLDESASQKLVPEQQRLEARTVYRVALAERRAGRLDEALASFQKATALDPEFDSAREQSAQLRNVLVMQRHEQALVYFRDQKLDEAIALWEQALALDEQFEPAQVYLARARALRSRLEELDS